MMMDTLPPEILDHICFAASACPGSITSLLHVCKYVHDCALPHRYRRVFACGLPLIQSLLAHIEARISASGQPPPLLCLVLSDRPLHRATTASDTSPSRTIARLIEALLGRLAPTLTELRCVLFERYDVPDLAGAFHSARDTSFPALRALSIYLGAGSPPRRALLPRMPRLTSLHLIGFGFELARLAEDAPELRRLRLSGQLVSAPLASAMRRLFAPGMLPAGVREVWLNAERVQRFVRDPFLDEAYVDIIHVASSSAAAGGPVLRVTWHTTREQHLQDLLLLCFPDGIGMI